MKIRALTFALACLAFSACGDSGASMAGTYVVDTEALNKSIDAMAKDAGGGQPMLPGAKETMAAEVAKVVVELKADNTFVAKTGDADAKFSASNWPNGPAATAAEGEAVCWARPRSLIRLLSHTNLTRFSAAGWFRGLRCPHVAYTPREGTTSRGRASAYTPGGVTGVADHRLRAPTRLPRLFPTSEPRPSADRTTDRPVVAGRSSPERLPQADRGPEPPTTLVLARRSSPTRLPRPRANPEPPTTLVVARRSSPRTHPPADRGPDQPTTLVVARRSSP